MIDLTTDARAAQWREWRAPLIEAMAELAAPDAPQDVRDTLYWQRFAQFWPHRKMGRDITERRKNLARSVSEVGMFLGQEPMVRLKATYPGMDVHGTHRACTLIGLARPCMAYIMGEDNIPGDRVD